MKNLLYTFLIVSIISCQTGKKEELNYVLFSGTVENPTSDKVRITGNDYKMEIPLNDDNAFSDTLWIPQTGYYSFAEGRESSAMFLNMGDQIHIDVNTAEFDETLSYTGKGAEKNNYLAKKYLESEINAPAFDQFFAMNENEFNDLNKLIYSQELDLLTSSSIPDENFVEMEKKALHYDHLANISAYEDYHLYLTKDEDFVVSDAFYSEFDGFNYDNEEDYANFSSYKTIVTNHYVTDISDLDGLDSTFTRIQMIESGVIKNDLLNSFRYSFSPAHPELEHFYALMMETSSDDDFKIMITEKFEKYEDLTAGNESPEFSYPNKDGKVISLEDLKGKLVYVDVWATWCGPCKREIPFLKELTTEYKGKDIAFVSISIDEVKDYDKWIAMMAEKEMEGIQLFADKDWKSDFVQAYAIEGIPRFILIDKEGKIISADASRPSDPKIREEFNSLL